MENKVSAVLEPVVCDEIKTKITEIGDKLPFLIDLKTDERKSILKYGDKSVAFVKKSYELATQNQGILP